MGALGEDRLVLMARKPKQVVEANEKADPDGRVWECVHCRDWTGYPAEHLWERHGDDHLAVEDFVLIRGALHKSRQPRAKPGYPDVPLF